VKSVLRSFVAIHGIFSEISGILRLIHTSFTLGGMEDESLSGSRFTPQ
jgi:hypothetical protein